MHIAKWKEPVYIVHMLYNSDYMIFGVKQNYEDQWLPGAGGVERRDEQAEHRGFLAQLKYKPQPREKYL